ncbi:MAG: MFS transporter [Reinekea sp.]
MLGLNRNIWILALAQPFALSLSPAIVLISGFIGTQLAPAHALATLPLSMMVVGVTLGAMPAAFFMQRYGRKKVFLSAMLIMMLAGLISAQAPIPSSPKRKNNQSTGVIFSVDLLLFWPLQQRRLGTAS